MRDVCMAQRREGDLSSRCSKVVRLGMAWRVLMVDGWFVDWRLVHARGAVMPGLCIFLSFTLCGFYINANELH